MSGKPAARLSDPTSCPVPGHGVNPIAGGSGDVIIEGLPAARLGDASACGSAIVSGVAATVTINGKPAATVGSVDGHGNSVISGSGTVMIGDAHSPAAFTAPVPMPLWALPFDEKIRLVDSEGAPLANVPYHVIDDLGMVHTGFSDETGHLPRIATTGQQSLTVTTGVAALEKWELA